MWSLTKRNDMNNKDSLLNLVYQEIPQYIEGIDVPDDGSIKPLHVSQSAYDKYSAGFSSNNPHYLAMRYALNRQDLAALRQAAINWEAQQQAYQQQMSDSERLRDEQRAYDHPAAQMQRERAAGKNPDLATGGSAGTGSGSTPISAPQLSSPQVDGMSTPYDTASAVFQGISAVSSSINTLFNVFSGAAQLGDLLRRSHVDTMKKEYDLVKAIASQIPNPSVDGNQLGHGISTKPLQLTDVHAYLSEHGYNLPNRLEKMLLEVVNNTDVSKARFDLQTSEYLSRVDYGNALEFYSTFSFNEYVTNMWKQRSERYRAIVDSLVKQIFVPPTSNFDPLYAEGATNPGALESSTPALRDLISTASDSADNDSRLAELQSSKIDSLVLHYQNSVQAYYDALSRLDGLIQNARDQYDDNPTMKNNAALLALLTQRSQLIATANDDVSSIFNILLDSYSDYYKNAMTGSDYDFFDDMTNYKLNYIDCLFGTGQYNVNSSVSIFKDFVSGIMNFLPGGKVFKGAQALKKVTGK